ncbi:Protein of unknown function (DUF3078) [Apibacter mensalis]|uniref:DUF3078 domain-containing protein n=1 Tax=Apibacter mensalis TaxID=1586267 RepID=A0A0X3APC3_9FLAO|nr:DUF3078 domain-containing protein [Apibacter mensalis]CVK16214.1 Protein of unknown function (DUF3078) [Apibacter mensalis]
MMKKILLFLFVSTLSQFIYAQQPLTGTPVTDTLTVPKKAKNWKISGDHSLIVNQSSFSNWIAGGTNSFGGSARIKYSLDYKKGKNIFKNKITIGYGQVNNKNDKMRKTDDILLLESMYGRGISKNWYASVDLSFKTQMFNGYDYSAHPDYTSKDRISSFMSPGYLTVGFGFDYKPDGNFQLSLLPITSKNTFVLDRKLQKKDNYGLKHDGDYMYMELGAMVNAKYKVEIMKNVVWDNSLSLFSNYLSHAERVDVNFGSVIDMKVNNHISTKLTFDLIYDHDQIKRVQTRQTFGIGLSYGFNSKNK